LSRFQNKDRNYSCAFLLGKNRALRSNSSVRPMAALRDFRCNPLRPTGFKKRFNFGTGSFI
jgi:hypothetical protein